MSNKFNNFTSNKTDDNPRYVRILYLKEVSKPRREPDNNIEALNDKKSIAYLSSLIQDERKHKPIDRSERQKREGFQARKSGTVSVVKQSQAQTLNDFKVGFYHRTSEKKNKDNTLVRIIGETTHPRLDDTLVKIKKRNRLSLPAQEQLDDSLKGEMENQFNNFCKILKPKLGDIPYPFLIAKPKSQFPEIQQRRILPKPSHNPNSPKQRSNTELSAKQRKRESFKHKNIVYKRNFKEINNFDWHKIAQDNYIV